MLKKHAPTLEFQRTIRIKVMKTTQATHLTEPTMFLTLTLHSPTLRILEKSRKKKIQMSRSKEPSSMMPRRSLLKRITHLVQAFPEAENNKMSNENNHLIILEDTVCSDRTSP